MSEIVSINGRVSSPAEAKISVFDRGFLYGDSVYEVARAYDGTFFGLEEHVDRLFLSAERIGLSIGSTKEEIIREIYKVFKEAGRNDGYMRIVVTRGEHRINLDPTVSTKSNVIIFIMDPPKIDQALYETGLDLITATVLRNTKKAMDPNIKSGNYLNNVLALGEARKKGAHDAIMVNRDGFVTEGTTWNIFMVLGDKIISPPDDADILHGITRKTLKKICQTEKMTWEEKNFTADELKKANEVFTTGSFKEVMPVRTIDGQKIGNKTPGPVTQKLMVLYKNAVKTYCDQVKR